MAQSLPVWFKLFASCVLVEGYAKSAIYDLERVAFYDVPNQYAELIKITEYHDLNSIKKIYMSQAEIVQEILNQFVDQEIGFFTSEPECFPPIDFTWEYPSFITNAIIELSNITLPYFNSIVVQLNNLLCRGIQLITYDSYSVEELHELLVGPLNESQIHYIELFVPDNLEWNTEQLLELMANQPRLRKIAIFSAEKDLIIVNELGIKGRKIVKIKNDLRLGLREKITKERFVANIISFSEALTFNLGLNRKVCIDRFGEIRNFLTHSTSFGNVSSTSIETLIGNTDFEKNWSISNDHIEVCKVCQYRYACISNSEIEIKDKKFFKTDECAFDPFSNNWTHYT